MEDHEIIGLFFARSEDALSAAKEKYGAYCLYIAEHILSDAQEAQECLNDALLSAWNSIPPKSPEALSTYLGKLTRNASLDRLRAKNAVKRGASVPLEDGESPFDRDISDDLSLKDAVNRFLLTLNEDQQAVFLQRYWYGCKEKEIAVLHQTSVGAIKAQLHRTKARFSTFLHKEGYDL